MKIYTRTGDQGETGLFGGPRVGKDELRLEACGTVDELNSFLGAARAETLPEGIDALLDRIQHELFEVGAELATVDPVAHGTRTIGALAIQGMEDAIDQYQARLPELAQFVLPGGSRAAAQLHVARAVCRRAERRVVSLVRGEGADKVSATLITYLNRLGDLLFVVARAASAAAGHVDVAWQKPARRDRP
jgi:cob(I)alamin adenosyltransferase